jgi:hypothetical protein
LLKLLVKYASVLKDDLQEGLVSTPCETWKNIIPQLFSRLNHPESYIRHSISQLLCRIARDYPHLIIYPAVVGSQDGPTKIETVNSAQNVAANEALNEIDETNNESKFKEEKNREEEIDEKSQQNDVNSQENTEGLSSNEADQDEEDQKQSEENSIDDQAGEEQENPEIGDAVIKINDQIEVKNDQQNDENFDENQVKEDDNSQKELKNTYKYLLNTLSESNPNTIEQVKLFVHEMRRITLLREELWCGTLNQIHSDINKRLGQLDHELTKVFSNQDLNNSDKARISKEKYEIFLHPIIFLLENVHEVTTKFNPQTPNEEQFQEEFGEKITRALDELKKIDDYATNPSQGWSLFKNLHQTFHQRSQKRLTISLQMNQISPKLALLKSTSIPIPGKDGRNCTIHSIGNTVTVLPTKTKPKKLYFIGSNGKRYQYLFKGLEDLHLDERIMQFLNIVNSIFSQVNKSESIQYYALNYSVTPLGPRSGLISWVEGATALFNLYKKWQYRESVYLASKHQQQQQQKKTRQGQKQQKQTNTVSANQIQILRPNELFYSKLNPILKEKNIKNFNENRAQCPLSVLRQVFDELSKETPNDLLSKELWYNSTTSGNWWKNIQIYSRSTAVMSIIGYIIGLGDRHLDNLLVDLNTGQVAHIDYNICFEKGLNLKVPEKIPFRLTQNLVNALGLTGVEGLFRSSCEQVMKVLRKERETLLTLLEAFVYDPLLDWTSSDTGIIASFYGGYPSSSEDYQNNKTIESEKNTRQNRKNQEKNLTHRLYAIRLTENRIQFSYLQHTFDNFFIKLNESLDFLNSLSKNRNEIERHIELHEKTKIYLDEILTLHTNTKTNSIDNQHSILTIIDRYSQYLIFTQNLNKVYSNLDALINYESKIKNCRDFFELMKMFDSIMTDSLKNLELKSNNRISLLNSVSVMKFSSSIELEEKQDDLAKFSTSNYSIIEEFLQSSGQISLFKQCQAYYGEIEIAREDRNSFAEVLYELITKNLEIFSWLPTEWPIKQMSKFFTLLEILKEIRALQIDKENESEVMAKNVIEACKIYKEIFNPNFTTPLFNHNSQQSIIVKEIESKKLMIQGKFNNLRNELELRDQKVAHLNLRKVDLDTKNRAFLQLELADTDLSSCLIADIFKLRHDSIENQIIQFIDVNQLDQNNSVKVFECLQISLIQFMNDNLQKWLQMESVALNVSRDQLISLLSADGDWFLDEMLSLILNCKHLASFQRLIYTKYNHLEPYNDQIINRLSFSKTFDSFEMLGSLFLSLKDLWFDYESIIMKKFLRQVSSYSDIFIQVMNQFDNINLSELLFEMISNPEFDPREFSNVS